MLRGALLGAGFNAPWLKPVRSPCIGSDRLKSQPAHVWRVPSPRLFSLLKLRVRAPGYFAPPPSASSRLIRSVFCVRVSANVLAPQADLWATHEPTNGECGPRGTNGVAASQSRPGFSTAAAPRCPHQRVAGDTLWACPTYVEYLVAC